jgi:site-specific DNA-cytosine methylase
MPHVACRAPQLRTTHWVTSTRICGIICCRVVPLRENLARQLRQIDAAQLVRLREVLDMMHEKVDGILSIGSLLSGTDLQRHVLDELATIFRTRFGLDYTMQIRFACEEVVAKQEYIKANFGPNVIIYPDVHQIAKNPKAVQDIDGHIKPIPRVVVLIFSIECDSISALSAGWQHRLRCEDGDPEQLSRTNGSLLSCMKVLNHCKPVIWVAECVKNLFAKDAETQLSMFDALQTIAIDAGYLIAHSTLDSSNYGVPQVRPRAWIVGVFVGVEIAQKQRDEDEHFASVDLYHSLLMQMRIAPLDLYHYMVAADDPIATRAAQIGLEASESTKTTKKKAKGTAKSKGKAKSNKADAQPPKEEKVAQYEVDHLEAFTTIGLAYPPVFSESFNEKTRALAHSTRMRELVFLETARWGHADKMDTVWVRDLNMSESWGSTVERKSPCIVSTSMMWVRGMLAPGRFVDRLLLGEECLALQGVSFEWQRNAKGFSFALNMDLAGNAFTAEVLGAVLLAALMALPVNHAFELENEILIEDKNRDDDAGDHGADVGEGAEEGGESETPLEVDDVINFGDFDKD